MNVNRASPVRNRADKSARCRAFTITELTVTLAICVLVSAGIAGGQLFGARMTELTQTKVHTSNKAAQLMRLLASDVRVARKVFIGAGSSSSFTPAAASTPQQGNALQIHPSDDPGIFIRYFYNPADSSLQRIDNSGSRTRVASGVTNSLVFTLEDFAGATLNDRQRNAVIGIDLRFNRLADPDVSIGPEHYYKSYRFRTRIAQPM